MLEIKNLSKWYEIENEKITVIENLNLTASANEFVSILGPSGCGKTTFLKCLARLTLPSMGEILSLRARRAESEGE